MSEKADIVGSAINILIHKGELSREKYPSLYRNINKDMEVISDIEILCYSLGLYKNQDNGVFYVSPINGFKTLGYNKEDLKKEFKYSFKNEDVQAALFIVENIVTEFYQETSIVPVKKSLRGCDLIHIVDNNDKIKGKNKKEKLQLIKTTLDFLVYKNLVILVECKGNTNIYITEKFKATVIKSYKNNNVQSKICEFIEDIEEEKS